MNGNSEKEYSNNIFIIKAFAILSVVSAHTVSNNNVISRLLNCLGVLGVPVFFFISGYLYKLKVSKKQFFISKLKYIVIPWIFCGTITYFINTFFGSVKADNDIYSYIRYILGDHSHLYYLTMLMLLYVMFFYLYNVRTSILLIVCLGINFTSIALFPSLYNMDINPYLNIFNWIMYFAFGLIVRRDRLHIVKYISLFRKYFIVILIFLIIVGINSSLSISYFTFYGLLLGSLSVLVFIPKEDEFNTHKISSIISQVGKESFSIYLLHLPLVGFLNLILKRYFIMNLVTPIIVVAVMTLILSLLKRVPVLKSKLYLLGLK